MLYCTMSLWNSPHVFLCFKIRWIQSTFLTCDVMPIPGLALRTCHINPDTLILLCSFCFFIFLYYDSPHVAVDNPTRIIQKLTLPPNSLCSTCSFLCKGFGSRTMSTDIELGRWLWGTHHYLGVTDSVLRDGDPVLFLFPLWWLVVHVGDDDSEIHWAAEVSSICSNDLLTDPWGLMRQEQKGD